MPRIIPVPQLAKSKTVACIGTGPSLTEEQINVARNKGFALFGCNRVFELAEDLDVLYGVNFEFWEYYWDRGLSQHTASKWTTNVGASRKFDLNWIDEKNESGLSDTYEYVHHGHGSGYTLVNLAYLMGAERIVLLGYDLKYAPDYDGKARQVGSKPRHYFGEYPQEMQHWPSVKVKDGVHFELVELYRSVAKQGLIEVINCTPDSAIDCFRNANIESI